MGRFGRRATKLGELAALATLLCCTVKAVAATHYTVNELPLLLPNPESSHEVTPAGLDPRGRAYVNVSGYLDGVAYAIIERCVDGSGCKQLPPRDLQSFWFSVAGQTLGGRVVDEGGVSWAARLTLGSPVELLLPSAVVHGVNRGGTAAGYVTDEPFRPFTYATSLQFLPTMGDGHPAQAHAINDKGLVVGEAEHPQRLNSCAVAWRAGALKVLQCPPSSHSARAYGVNKQGVAVGSGYVKGAAGHATRFEGGQTFDLGALGKRGVNWSLATAIDDNGIAIGYGSNLPTDGMPNAIVFDPIEGAIEMAALIPKSAREKYYLTYPQSISETGQILVRAYRLPGYTPVVLRLDPVAAH